MMGREVSFPDKSNLTIVSLVPSQTELLYDLGLDKQIIGQTIFCIHPKEKFSNAIKVGGTKKINLAKIKQLNPDIIIGNKEENDQEQIFELAKHYPVWMSDIQNEEDNLRMISELGIIFNSIGSANHIKQQIILGFSLLKAKVHSQINCVYLIWKDPLMVAGQNTFIDKMLSFAGFKNMVKMERYPEVSLDSLVQKNPEVILLSTEPYPFKDEHISFFNKALPNSKVLLVDGEMFSWYGSRMIKAPSYFFALNEKLLNHA